MSTLEYIFKGYPEIREHILDNLNASYSSLISQLLNYQLTKREQIKYLNILRDLQQYKPWIENNIKAGNHISLVGTDVSKLLVRIKDPEKFWQRISTVEKIIIWIVCINYGTSTSHSIIPPSTMHYGTELDTSRDGNWITYGLQNDLNLNIILYTDQYVHDTPLFCTLLETDCSNGNNFIRQCSTDKMSYSLSNINIFSNNFSADISHPSKYNKSRYNRSVYILLCYSNAHCKSMQIFLGTDLNNDYMSKNMNPHTTTMNESYAIQYIRYLF